MEELFPGIFMQEIRYQDKHTNPFNLYVIKGEERSLLVDTGFGVPECRDKLLGMLSALNIGCDELDVFITHNHPDHVGMAAELAGRGAKCLMNPLERDRRFDLLHCYMDESDAQRVTLRAVGVTEEGTPELYRIYQQRNREKTIFDNDMSDFPFTSIEAGEVLSYGKYRLRVLGLRGHTYGQLGLLERDYKILFCADQVMTRIAPIVGSMYPDIALLECYMDSLAMIKHACGDCLGLSSHYEVMRDIKKEVDRIVFSYLDKADTMKRIVESAQSPMTVRQVAQVAYGIPHNPENVGELATFSMILAKTFSCLEYIYQEGFVSRLKSGGVLYWSE